jgi:AraC-like DNA-binding protein
VTTRGSSPASKAGASPIADRDESPPRGRWAGQSNAPATSSNEAGRAAAGTGTLAESDVADFLKYVYRPFDEPADLMRAVVDGLAPHKRLSVVEAQLSIENRHAQALVPSFSAAQTRRPGMGEPVPFPIRYGQRVLGELVVLLRPLDEGALERRFLHGLVRALGLLLQRYDVRSRARSRQRHDLWFMGIAPCLLRFEAQLERVAPLALPLVIQGEFGCEKEAAGFAVHVASRPHQALHEVRCSEAIDGAAFAASLDRLRRADLSPGTLFLHDVDELNARSQRLLTELLSTYMSSDGRLPFGTPATTSNGVRIIASTTRSLRELSEHGEFSRELWAALDYLRLAVPALRDRRDDIPLFIERFAVSTGYGRTRFTPEVVAILSGWNWLGNLIELERVLVRLLATAHGSVVGTDDLRQWAEELLPDVPATSFAGITRAAVEDYPHDEESGPAIAHPSPQPFVLARQLLAGRFDDIESFHPGLQRALKYLAQHFHEEIALNRLARESFVSPSYQCALFKKTVGMGFKRFQSILRVERAKDLLVHQRHHRITDISLDVGFGDFSHFLKTFKRFTHVSPREFRKQQGVDAFGAGARDTYVPLAARRS